MTYPSRLFGIYRERPPDSRCCEHCSLNGKCSLDTEHTAEILRVGADMARIRIGGRIIDVPLTEIHFKEEIKLKATGIIRRIDELGRIVIPKELRRILHIKEGDPIEIFTGDDGVIALRKYEPTDSVLSYLERLEELVKDEEFRHKNKMLVKIAELEALLKIEEPPE